MHNYSLTKGTILRGCSYSYEIVNTLGQGSFGITYLAKVRMEGSLGSIQSDMFVAIKEFFMKEINGRDGFSVTNSNKNGLFADYRKKFVREAMNLSKLQHPNIIKVLECFEVNNTVYYAMEYLDGGSLDELINMKHRLSEPETIKYVRQIANALSYMHEHKVLHLDLKPGNVMLHNGNAVLIDFGLSKQYDSNGNPESSTTVGGGTPGYAPIEQANYNEGKEFPVTMDIYALGATMYKMLLGVRPPEASIILNEGFPKCIFNNINCSKKIVDCIVKAMSPLKKDRFDSVEELAQCLNLEDAYTEDEETTIEDMENISVGSSDIKDILERMIASKQYREAYNMCLVAVKRDSNDKYALRKIEELVPLLKEKSKKDKRKHWIIAIIITMVGFILTVLAAILQS